MTYSDFGHADFKAPPERPAGSNGLCVSGVARLVVMVGVMTRKKQMPQSLDSAAVQWLTALEIPRTSGLKGS